MLKKEGPKEFDPYPFLTLNALPATSVEELQPVLQRAASMHPIPLDSEALNPRLVKMLGPTPSYYPQDSPADSDSLTYYQCLTPETLFFIFYYLPATRAQWMAAKVLNQLSWRFHTQRRQWFQRYQEPITVTEEYEKGHYLYFDCGEWTQLKVCDFTFEYRFLHELH